MAEEDKEQTTTATQPSPELEREWEEEIRYDLMDELDLDNIMAVPEVQKIVVNMGIGQNEDQRERINAAKEDLATITTQQPVVTRARRAVAGFNIRTGDPIGLKVTLKRTRMYAFLERLVKVAIPRIKDFRGLDPDAMDGQGNFTMGVPDQAVFPEIPVNDIEYPQGMDISFTTTADTDEEGLALLKALGMPFQEE